VGGDETDKILFKGIAAPLALNPEAPVMGRIK
jgi:hypothetical protein